MREEEKNQFKQENQPLCRFGPRDDFTNIWPAEALMSLDACPNRLDRFLKSLSEIISAVFGSELEAAETKQICINYLENTGSPHNGEFNYAEKNNILFKPVNPPTTRIIESNLKFQGQAMLFANNSGVGRPIRYKPKHNIRAYRQTAKKRTAFNNSGQGSLFADNFKGTKTA